MNSILISVIVPVYNVKPYLERCVNSVINQTYSFLEIILVDDGSTDGSSILCDVFAKTDSRIIVIHQKNQGLSVARNTGINIAKGDWIAFLDSDDWIEPNMYEVLLKISLESDSDIASCMSYRCLSQNDIIPSLDGKVSALTKEDIIKGLICNKVVLFEVWNKLWKRSLIGDTRFKPGQVSEDVYFDRILFMKTNKMVHINLVLHHYLVNRPGNTNSSFKVARLCIFAEFDEWIKDLILYGKTELAEMIATVSAQFAIHIYEEAIFKKQSISIKQTLIEMFLRDYSRCGNGRYFFGNYGIKAKMMLVNPKMYAHIWLLIGKIRAVLN